MSSPGELLTLQELDRRRERDRVRLVAVEASMAGDPELDRLRRQARRSQRERAALEAETSAQEQVVAGLRKRAGALDRHLYDGTVGNPQELLGMQHDLDMLRRNVALEEERQLELMERAEIAAGLERAAGAALAARSAERDAGAEGVAAEAVALQEAIESQDAERDAVVAGLAAADVGLYERLRTRLKPAVVRLAADSCGGCHMPFGNAEVRRVHGGDRLVQCANCDRIVVS